MKRKKKLPAAIVAAIGDGQMLGIRAGTQPHRIIGIWAVVVEGRVFVRSWSVKPRSWYRTFLEDPRGVIAVSGREIPVRAVRTRGERLKDGVLDSVVLWNTMDLGYLTIQAANALAKGSLRAGDKTFTAGRLKQLTIDGDSILLGTPFTFTRDNVDGFDF